MRVEDTLQRLGARKPVLETGRDPEASPPGGFHCCGVVFVGGVVGLPGRVVPFPGQRSEACGCGVVGLVTAVCGCYAQGCDFRGVEQGSAEEVVATGEAGEVVGEVSKGSVDVEHGNECQVREAEGVDRDVLDGRLHGLKPEVPVPCSYVAGGVLIGLDQVLQERVDTGLPTAVERQHPSIVGIELCTNQAWVNGRWRRIDEIVFGALNDTPVGLIARQIRQPHPVKDECATRSSVRGVVGSVGSVVRVLAWNWRVCCPVQFSGWQSTWSVEAEGDFVRKPSGLLEKSIDQRLVVVVGKLSAFQQIVGRDQSTDVTNVGFCQKSDQNMQQRTIAATHRKD